MGAIGIDTHKATLAACAVDELGTSTAERTFADDQAGHRSLLTWAAVTIRSLTGVWLAGGSDSPLSHRPAPRSRLLRGWDAHRSLATIPASAGQLDDGRWGPLPSTSMSESEARRPVRKRRKQPLGQTIGGIMFGFEQQVLRTTPPPYELVHHARPDDPVSAADGTFMTVHPLDPVDHAEPDEAPDDDGEAAGDPQASPDPPNARRHDVAKAV